MTRALTGVALALLALVPARASAFRLGETYAEPAIDGGGGERWFTGSADDGYSCAICHRGAPEPMVELRGLPELGYVPGETYDIEIPLPASITSSATLELVDALGSGVGSLTLPAVSTPDLCASVGGAPPEPASSTASTRRGRQVGVADACGADRLAVRWTAPAEARGPVWVHAAVVAADGSGDPEGDGVRVITRVIPSYGSAPDATRVGSPACAAGRRSAPAPGAALAIVLALLVRRSHRRRALARRAPDPGSPQRGGS